MTRAMADGAGLSIVRQLVTLMGGEVRPRASRAGVAVRVTLPLEETDQQMPAKSGPGDEVQRPQGLKGHASWGG